MADDNKTNEPKAASLSELKKTFPDASAEWRESQLENDATLEEASIAYATHCQEEMKKAQQEAADAKEAAEKAEADAGKSGGTKSTRGVNTDATGESAGTADDDTKRDYHALARERQEKTGCTRRQAMAFVKKKYGDEARAAFMRGTLDG